MGDLDFSLLAQILNATLDGVRVLGEHSLMIWVLVCIQGCAVVSLHSANVSLLGTRR